MTTEVPLDLSIGETRFFFRKMSAMQAFPVAEMIRHELKNIMKDLNLEESDPDSFASEIKTALQVVLGARPAFVETLRHRLFGYIDYMNAKTTRQCLAGSEDQAFSNLKLIAVYEVLVHALKVNFWDFFEEVQSKVSDLAEA